MGHAPTTLVPTALGVADESPVHNGLGRSTAARDAAREAFDCDTVGYRTFIAPELGEAASRAGDTPLVVAANEWLSDHTAATTSDWALAIAASVRAVLADVDDVAERDYRESIERLSRTRLRVPLARGHLRGDLTPQNAEIARLAADGLSNQEIGSRLFLSHRTIEWHLKKVFTKLDITSRKQLAGALHDAELTVAAA